MRPLVWPAERKQLRESPLQVQLVQLVSLVSLVQQVS